MPIWNDTDLFHVKSHTQQDGGGAQFRSYDFLLKSRENFSSQTQSLSLPFGASSSEVVNSEFTEEGAHYVFEERFSQSWLLDSSYPSGFYDWTIGTGDLSNRVEHTVYVSGGSYPFDVPEIIGGNWSGGSLVLDSSNPVIQISPWFGSDSNDRLEYGFWSPTGASGASASASSSSLNLDWMNLDPGEEMQGYLFFVDVISEQENQDLQGDRYNARFGRVSALYFTIRGEGGGSDNSDHSVSGGDLQILEASYGASGGSNEVTGHLQSMLSGNSLSMYVSSSQLGGDPAFGQVKALTVRYSYGGSVYETSVQEGGMLMIPDTSHGGVGGGGSVDTGGGGGSSRRSPIWNDTDLFHVKSHTQQDGGGAQFRSYDFLLKSLKTSPRKLRVLVFRLGRPHRRSSIPSLRKRVPIMFSRSGSPKVGYLIQAILPDFMIGR